MMSDDLISFRTASFTLNGFTMTRSPAINSMKFTPPKAAGTDLVFPRASPSLAVRFRRRDAPNRTAPPDIEISGETTRQGDHERGGRSKTGPRRTIDGVVTVIERGRAPRLMKAL